MCTTCVPGAQGGQNSVSDPRIGVKDVVSHHRVWVLGNQALTWAGPL